MPATEPRYLPKYRQDEIRLACDCAFRGESLCFVGIAGVGKSNVINYLRDSQNSIMQYTTGIAEILFCVVDATIWERTPTSLWQLMDNALRERAASLSPQFQEGTIVPLLEEDRTFNRLKSRLRWVCQEMGYRVVFVLDDFDLVFETGPGTMVEQLNNLRSEDNNREKLSYLIFTRKLPHVLGRKYDLRNSKFFDLIRHTHFALEPYTPDDARQMLKHLNSMVVNALSPGELPRIQELAGGHARLLRILFDLWASEGPPPMAHPEDFLAAKTDVQQECERIFMGLHKAEQEVALLVAYNAHTSAHAQLVNHLERRGLLVHHNPDGQIQWFSPLMERFLKTHARQGDTP